MTMRSNVRGGTNDGHAELFGDGGWTHQGLLRCLSDPVECQHRTVSTLRSVAASRHLRLGVRGAVRVSDRFAPSSD